MGRKSLRLSHYFIRLFLFSLILGTAPLVVQGWLSYQMTSQVVLKKVMESHTLRNLGTQMQVEQLLNSIQSNILQFSSSTEVIHALQTDLTWENYDLISNLLNTINRLQVVKSGVPSVALFDLKHNWVINDGLFRYSEYPSIIPLDHYFKKIGKSKWATDGDIFGEETGHSVSNLYLVQRVPTFNLMLEGMIVTKLPITEISKVVATGSLDSGMFMIVNETGQMIAHTNGFMSEKVIEKADWFKKLNGERGYLFTEYEGTRVGIFYQRSAWNGWVYISAVPFNVFQKDLENVQWMAIITCACLFAGALILSFIGSRNMYSPIARLFRTVHAAGSTGLQTDENKDEFNMIVQRFQQIVEERASLQEQLHRQFYPLKDYFMQRLLRGEIEEEEGRAKLPIFKMPVQWTALAVFAVQIDSLHNTRFSEKDRDLLMIAINNMVTELIPADTRLDACLIDQFQAAVVCFQNEDQEHMDAEVYKLAACIQQKADHFFGLKVSIGISNRYHRLSETSKAFQEAKEMLKYRIQLEQEAILYVPDVLPQAERTKSVFPHALESRLLDSLWTESIEVTQEILTAIFQHMLSAGTNYRESEYMLVRLLVNILKSAEDMNVPIEDVIFTERSLFGELLDLNTPADVENWLLHQILIPLKVLNQNHRRPEYKKIAEEIVRMVGEEQERNLTLELCAVRLGISPYTVKRIMRMELGTNFSEYVSVVRLETAKKWLTTTDMSISKISEKLHYNNSQNFIRYFRKMVGITPGQYRESKRQK